LSNGFILCFQKLSAAYLSGNLKKPNFADRESRLRLPGAYVTLNIGF